MPGTLVHLGLQGLATRAVWRSADLAWVYIGCVLPDLPWIICRAAEWIAPWIPALDLRLYGTVQSSLAFSVLLAGALALFATAAGRAFGLMASAAVAHLALDAVEIKWGAGVLFLAPFDWRATSFGLIRTDGWVAWTLTAVAVAVLIAHVPSALRGPALFTRPPVRRAAAGAALLCAWLGLPLLWMGDAEASGFQDLALLRDTTSRVGRSFVMDRAPLAERDGRRWAIALNREPLEIEGDLPDSARKASIRAVFTTPGRIRVEEALPHHPWWREVQTMIGLGLVAVVTGIRLR